MSQNKSPAHLESPLGEYRARLEAALCAEEIGTWTWDISNDVVRGDRNLNGMFGLPPTDCAGRPIAEYLNALHPEDLPKLTEAIGRAIAVGGEDHFEMEYRLMVAGRELWICARGVVERRADGVAVRLPGVVLDITRQKQLSFERERLLEESQRQARVEKDLRGRATQFEALFNEAPFGMYLLDADFRIREVNAIARGVFADIPNLIGRDFDEVIHAVRPAECAGELVRVCRHTLETGEPGQGDIHAWQVNRVPLPDGRHGVVCYLRGG